MANRARARSSPLTADLTLELSLGRNKRDLFGRPSGTSGEKERKREAIRLLDKVRASLVHVWLLFSFRAHKSSHHAQHARQMSSSSFVFEFELRFAFEFARQRPLSPFDRARLDGF